MSVLLEGYRTYFSRDATKLDKDYCNGKMIKSYIRNKGSGAENQLQASNLLKLDKR